MTKKIFLGTLKSALGRSILNYSLSSLFWYCFLEGVCFLIGVTTELSLFIGLRVLGLGELLITCWAISNLLLAFLYCDCIFWVGFLYLFLTFFAVIFVFYFLKLIFWKWNVRQIMYVFSFPSTPVSSTYMSIIPIKSIGLKNDLLLWLNFWIFSWETIIFQLIAIWIFAFAVVKM